MALIKCNECGKEISESADMCPHCGFSLKKYKEQLEQDKKYKNDEKYRKGCLYFILFVIMFFIIGIACQPKKDNQYKTCVNNCGYGSRIGAYNMHENVACQERCSREFEARKRNY
ncbi:MAG: zinc-ribbon domain-containing protein [Alphaproteobacteria bacterium]|nr:zinc-ribbon domain-containing protein [Alphaproteobacteria bacterium]